MGWLFEREVWVEVEQPLSAYRYESYTVGAMAQEESDVAIVGTKGQIVIPQRFRKQLDITPNTKLVVYRKDDKLIVAKLKIPPLQALNELFREIDEKNKGKKELTEQEILNEIQAYRASKRAKHGE